MFGLFYKDLLTLKKTIVLSIILSLFYVLIPLLGDGNVMMANMFVLIAPMFAVTSYYYDVASRWGNYALVLPMSRKKVVASKYMMMLILLFASMIISALTNVLAWIFVPEKASVEALWMVLIAGSLGVLFASVLLPLIYRFGVERARLVMIVGAMLLGGGVGALMPLVSSKTIAEFSSWGLSGIALFAAAVACVVLALSYICSVKINEKRRQ